MIPPVSPEVLRALSILALALLMHIAAEKFKNIEPNWRSTLISPLRAGLVAGAATALCGYLLPGKVLPVVASVIMVLTAGYLERNGVHGESLDGLLTGSIAGVSATAVMTLIPGGDPLIDAATLLVAGGMSGLAFSFIAGRWTINSALVVLSAIVPTVIASYLPSLLATSERRETIAATAALFPPIVVFIAVFVRWPSMRKELRNESNLGLIDPSEVDSVSHPLKRLFSGGWPDRATRRRFVSVANTLATRKRQQRVGDPELQKLHQLEILQLRMELQETYETHLALRRSQNDALASSAASGPPIQSP